MWRADQEWHIDSNIGVGCRVKKMTDTQLVIPRPANPPCPTAIMPLQQSKSGGSGAFLVRADDDRRYWCKCLDNPQGPRVPINEQIVGRLGSYLEAAVCEVSLIRIPPELEGWDYRPGRKLVPGYAHGSRALPNAIETRSMNHPHDDQNPTRMTSLKILADLCWAGDCQWLYAPGQENSYYSHDHGHFFPSGPNWTIDSLRANSADQPSAYPGSLYVPDVVTAFADKLDRMTALDIAGVLAGIPEDWPVTNEELEEMVLYLDRRRSRVVQRLRSTSNVGVSQ